MKPRSLAISGIWVLALTKAFHDGRQIPDSPVSRHLPDASGSLMFLLFPFIFFSLAAFLQRRKPIAFPLVTETVAARLGLTRANEFLVRANQFLLHLRPYALFMTCCYVFGVTGLVSTYLTTGMTSGYIASGFFLSAGLGLALAYVLSIIFPPRLRG